SSSSSSSSSTSSRSFSPFDSLMSKPQVGQRRLFCFNSTGSTSTLQFGQVSSSISSPMIAAETLVKKLARASEESPDLPDSIHAALGIGQPARVHIISQHDAGARGDDLRTDVCVTGQGIAGGLNPVAIAAKRAPAN